MYDSVRTALTLATLDAAMRRIQGRERAIAARIQFYEAAVSLFAIRRLNSLGELVRSSRLSERSLDVIFEDDRYSDAVIAAVLHRVDKDAEFRKALVEQEGELCLAYWRQKQPIDLFGHPIAA